MGIMTRIVRIFKVDVHGVMDQMEDKSLLLKQTIRDMEEELDRKETILKNLILRRDRVIQERRGYTRDLEGLERDLAVALKKEKDDIARMLIRKIKPLSDHTAILKIKEESLDEEIAARGSKLEEQRLTCRQFNLKVMDYLHKAEQSQWEETFAGAGPGQPTREISDEEIELELIKRRESLNTGGLEK